MSLASRPSSVAFGFLALLGVIVLVARAATVNTTGPWFSPRLSLYVYTATLICSGVVAVVASLLASHRAARLDEILRLIDVRLDDLRTRGFVPEPAPKAPAGLDDLVESLEERRGHDSLAIAEADRPIAQTALGLELARERDLLRAAKARVWKTVAGPILLAVGFAAVAGAMLPGAEDFAASNYQLNSTFVLVLSFGWTLVLLWLVVAIVTLPTLSVLVREPRAGTA